MNTRLTLRSVSKIPIFFFLLLLSSLLFGCFSSSAEDGTIHRNTYGGYYYRAGSNGKSGGYVYVTASNDTLKVDDAIPKRTYPGLYKNKLCYASEHHLVFVSPKDLSRDTVLLHDKFLGTSFFFEYDRFLVVMDYDQFDVIDMHKKRLMMASDIHVGNVTISGNTIYAIADIKDYTEQPEYWIMKGNIYDGNLTKVKRFPDFPEAKTDCTTEGWNGMLVSHGVLFVKGQNNLFAYNATTGRKLDQVSEFRGMRMKRNNAAEVVFEFDGDEYTFSFGRKKFE